MLEKDCQTKFNKWCKENFKASSAFELKVMRGKSLPFSDVQEHQVYNLKCANEGRFIWKIPDMGYTNPFDSFILYKVPAYVVIFHEKKEFVMIPIKDWIKEEKTSKRKSITLERAMEIGITCNLNQPARL